MGRAVLLACLPWAVCLLVAVGAALLLVRIDGSRFRLRRLRRLWRLHRNEAGGAQSLAFVLTLPFFVMILLFIVQVSQLMIATVVVHYAAYAAARSASVWIPANVGEPETANRISYYAPDPEAPDQHVPIMNPDHPDFAPSEGGVTYLVEPGSLKYAKIESAAVMACLPICPSRDTGAELDGEGARAAEIVDRLYSALSPESTANRAIPRRLRNKMAYAMDNTRVEIRFYHKNTEPPLRPYWIPPAEFRYNELGWQDQITVTVHHDLALLPGPGRLLARETYRPGGEPDSVSETIERRGSVYVYPLKASIAMGNEGEKSVIPYLYDVY